MERDRRVTQFTQETPPFYIFHTTLTYSSQDGREIDFGQDISPFLEHGWLFLDELM
jgi:hypothetical protein